METLKVEETTSTLNKAVVLLVATISLVGLGIASHGSGSIIQDGASIGDTSYSVPNYDSNQEILYQLVAPFVLVSLLLQLTLNTFLRTVLIPSNNYLPSTERRAKKKTIRRNSTLMALAITAMLVPSPFWNYIILAGGSMGLIAVTIVLFVFALIFYWVVTAGGGNTGE